MSHRLDFAALALWTLLSLTTLSPVSAGDAAKQNEEPQADAAELIEKALAEKVTFEFNETPLGDVVAFLRDLKKINVHIDRQSLEDAGAAHDTPLTLKASGITLRSALKHLLQPADLTFVVANGVLQVTTPETRCVGSQCLKSYDVSDLLAAEEQQDIEQRVGTLNDTRTLLEAIQVCLAPMTWDEVGGPGSISYYSGQFVVSQTDDVHESLASLLAALRKMKESQAKQPGGKPVWASPHAEASDRLRAAMQKKVNLELNETPLTDLIDLLRDEYKIPLRLDRHALDNAGVAPDTLIELNVKNVTLENALRLALEPHDMRAIIADELVVFTMVEVAYSHQHVRVYPVIDLIKLAQRDVDTDEAYEKLTQMLTTAIRPENWDMNGGPNVLSYHAASGALIVSGTEEVQGEVESALNMIRQALAAARPAAQAANAENKPALQTRVYSLYMAGDQKSEDAKQRDGDRRTETAKQLAEMLPSVVAPETWGASGAVAKACDGQLVVRQTAAVHKQLVKFLHELGITVPQSTGMGGTGVF